MPRALYDSTYFQGGYDLSVVYTDALKKTALRYGPNSKEVATQLAVIDDVLQVLLV